MIYTVTFNPAVDYVIHINSIKQGTVNRPSHEEIYFGGKGINVSLVLAELGVKSTALGFVAGFTGKAIEDYLKAKGIETDFVHLDSGFSRINVKIKSDEETEINGQGADITKNKIDEFFGKLDRLNDGDTLILAGSVPKSMPNDIYEKILEYIKPKKIRIVVDAEKNLLLPTLKYNPFLIKPNHIELSEIFDKRIESAEETIKYAHELQNAGAVNVIVSRGGKGAILVDEYKKTHLCRAYDGTVKNTVGAGDSMIAGFLVGYDSKDYKYALEFSVVCGCATAFSDGLASAEDIHRLNQRA